MLALQCWAHRKPAAVAGSLCHISFLSLCCCSGPASLSTDLSAAYHLLSTRICPPDGGRALSGRERDRSAAETPLAKSLLSVRDPQELTSK